MSTSIKYKGEVIATINDNAERAITTGGNYCEADIIIENTKDGVELSDGIIVKSRDTQGFPTELDIYGELWENALSYKGSYYYETLGWRNVRQINLKTNQSALSARCFNGFANLEFVTGLENVSTVSAYCLCSTRILDINLPSAVSIACEQPFSSNPALQTASFPKISGNLTAGTYALFRNCTALKDVVLGGVGHGLRNNNSANAFQGCTQSGLTICVYCNGTNVNPLMAAIRNGATNATIIVRASEDTDYGNTSYAAGEMIITSSVEVTE